jgi:hypothetical protein
LGLAHGKATAQAGSQQQYAGGPQQYRKNVHCVRLSSKSVCLT